MRGVSRFRFVRKSVTAMVGLLNIKANRKLYNQLDVRLAESIFGKVNIDHYVERLTSDGAVEFVSLPSKYVEDIFQYAMQNPCFADRDPSKGFYLENRNEAEEKLGKPILVAQYLNTEDYCESIRHIANDPVIEKIAAQYLGAPPVCVAKNLWWTFPVNASKEDKMKHAHVFHSDLDDFKFIKFFFYITDVGELDGPHVFVKGSNNKRAYMNNKRMEDDFVELAYRKDNIITVTGPAGTCLIEDTITIHKGLTPAKNPRLILQIQFALFDYQVLNDNVKDSEKRMIFSVN